MGLAAPGRVASSQTKAPDHVPCMGRQILSHCATREVLDLTLTALSHSLSTHWGSLLRVSRSDSNKSF